MLCCCTLSIDFTAVPNAQDPHGYKTILNGAYDTPVADPVFPVRAERRSSERFSDLTWVVERRHSVSKESHKASLNLFVQLRQFLEGRRIEFNLVSQACALPRRVEWSCGCGELAGGNVILDILKRFEHGQSVGRHCLVIGGHRLIAQRPAFAKIK